jgi:glycosyltransferase involved in cell wall biosynthesis
MTAPLNLGYLTTRDTRSINSWSGTPYFTRMYLDRAANVSVLDRIGPGWLESLGFGLRGVAHRLRGYNYWHECEPRYRSLISREIRERLGDVGVDVVLTDHSAIASALPPELPSVLWVDSNFAAMQDYYDFVSRVPPSIAKAANGMEQDSLDRVRFAVFSSDWAAEAALRHYRVREDKVKVVPFGANLEQETSGEAVSCWIAARPQDVCQLLFIGMDWKRKGGDLAVAIAERLNQSGCRTVLRLVGAVPPQADLLPAGVTYEGKLDKTQPVQLARFEELLRGAHFLVVPSEAECYGIVFAEASAHGVPSLAIRTGGIPSVVKDDVNGRLFGRNAEEFVRYIKSVMSDRAGYARLAHSSYCFFQAELNWTVAVRRILDLMHIAAREYPAP